MELADIWPCFSLNIHTPHKFSRRPFALNSEFEGIETDLSGWLFDVGMTQILKTL
jgi:hypothetical protein